MSIHTYSIKTNPHFHVLVALTPCLLKPLCTWTPAILFYCRFCKSVLCICNPDMKYCNIFRDNKINIKKASGVNADSNNYLLLTSNIEIQCVRTRTQNTCKTIVTASTVKQWSQQLRFLLDDFNNFYYWTNWICCIFEKLYTFLYLRPT